MENEIHLSFSEFLNEVKGTKTIQDVKKILHSSEFDMKDAVYVKKNELVVIDTFFYGEDRARKSLKDAWEINGTYGKYFYENFGLEFILTDSFSEFKAKGRHKKLTDTGIVGVHLIIAKK